MRDAEKAKLFFNNLYSSIMSNSSVVQSDPSKETLARLFALQTQDKIWEILVSMETRAYNRGYMAAKRSKNDA